MSVLTNGTTIERETAVAATYEVIGSVTNFTPPSRSRAAVDVSHLGSTVRTAKAGMLDNGEFSFEVLFDQSDVGQQNVEDDFEAGTEKNYRLTLNDGGSPTTRTFPCIVTGFQIVGGGIDSPVSASVSLKVVGAIS